MREDVQLIALNMLRRYSFFVQYDGYFKSEHFRSIELQNIRRAVRDIFTHEVRELATVWDLRLRLKAWGLDLEDYNPILKRLEGIPVVPDQFRQKLVQEMITVSSIRMLARTALETIDAHEEVNLIEFKSEVDRLVMDLTDEKQRRGDYATSVAEYLGKDFFVPIGIQHDLSQAVGVGAGEIALCEALIHSGKSTWVVNVAVNHAKTGGNVVVVTADEPRRRYIRRFDQCILGVTKDMLLEQKGLADKARSRVREWGGSIEIHDVTHQKTTVEFIGARLDQLEQGGRAPTMLMVDYPDRLFEPGTPEPRMKVDAIYAGLARLGSRFGIPVWVVSQINRENYTAFPRLGMSAWSSSKEEMASSILVLQRNAALDEMKKVEVTVLKSRNEDFRPRMTINADWSRQLMWG